MSDIKSKLLEWVQKHTGDGVGDLGKGFADGSAFMTILNRCDPERADGPLVPGDDAMDNVKRAFEEAGAKYGVPTLIDMSDPEFYKDDKVSDITYG